MEFKFPAKKLVNFNRFFDLVILDFSIFDGGHIVSISRQKI
jgi:hypothetical protein